MATLRRWLAVQAAALLLVSGAAAGARAETAPGNPPAVQPAVQENYKDAQFVMVTLGPTDQEQGIRLVGGQPDGLTQPSPDLGGRQSMPNPVHPERYFYFDVHDTYIHGGKNTVQMTVTYRDLGLAPIYIEYDSFDPARPNSTSDDVTKKRLPVATRTNSEGIKTASFELDDARFAGGQPGGADFRIFSTDDLFINNVSVLLAAHADPVVIRVVLDGKLLTFDPADVQPFVHPATGRTLVPLRAIFNALGIPNSDIVWHEDTRTVEATKGGKTIALAIDDVNVKVNGIVQREKLDQPATIVDGRTVVPLRFVATQFGLQVGWNEATHTVTLTSPAPVPVQQQPVPPSNPQQP